MPVDKEISGRVLAQIDRNELAQLGCDLTSIPSPTGQEKAIAEFILAWFESNGIKAVRQEVEPDRPNAVGIVKGDGSGLSLGFNGHMDTSFTGTSADLRMVAELEPESELKGRIVGDKVQGLGISNMKAGLAAFMIAGKALRGSGVKLKGDVVLAAVVGEISRTPIGPWQSQDYRGEGVGTRHLLTHGMHTDYAVCCDGSDLNIVWTQAGVVQAKITTFGKAEAAWGTKRSAYPMERVNAIVKMTKIIAAIERWGAEFEEKHIYQSPTGPLFPEGQYRRDRRRRAVPAELFSRRLHDLCRHPHAAAGATGCDQARDGAGAESARRRLRARVLQIAARLRRQECRAAGEVGRRRSTSTSSARRSKPSRRTRQHLDRYEHLQRARHPRDQDRSARATHFRQERGNRYRRDGEGGAALRADGARYLQPRTTLNREAQ